MPRTARTPPPNTSNSLIEVQSEPNLTGLGETTSINVNTRKRMRVEDTCCDSSQFEELKSTLSSWKADQDVILKKLVADVAELKLQNQSIKDSNSEIIKSMHFMNKNYEEMKMKVEEFEKEKKNLHGCILELEKKIQDFQYMSRTSSVEIRNIPANDKETLSDLSSVVTRIGTALKVEIGSNDLRDVYRIPGKKGINRGIVAEFTTVNMKSTLLAAVRNYNKRQSTEKKLNTEMIGIPGKRQPVFVAEFLPPSTRRIFYMARNFVKNNKYDFCWVSNGNVFIRKEVGAKQLHIQSEQSLLKLGSQQ